MTRFRPGDRGVRRTPSRPERAHSRVRLRAGEGVRADAERHVVRGGIHPPALRGPGAPGSSTTKRSNAQAGRQGPHQRGIWQCRAVRGPDREVDGRRGDRRLRAPPSSTWSARSAPTMSSTTRRSTTRRPASGTTGSSTPTRTTRSAGPPCPQAERRLRDARRRHSGPLLDALLVGALVSLRSDRYSGLMLWWKPFHRADVDRLKELIAEGKLQPSDRAALSVERDRRSAAPRRGWQVHGQGRRHDGCVRGTGVGRLVSGAGRRGSGCHRGPR